MCFFNYLFLAALGLRCCIWVFSRWGEQGLLSGCAVRASHCDGFSYCGAQALEHTGFSRVALRLSCSVGSSWTRDRTPVLCIGRWILNHGTTREVLSTVFWGNSLVVPWLGLGAFTVMTPVQSLVKGLKSWKPCVMAKTKKQTVVWVSFPLSFGCFIRGCSRYYITYT